ncbi:FadR/GntR family transcriptional regulator [Ectopseudomonas khazarica]|uniref:FadR/GntR family transcriptional regulator n=1 Tax=Ectopseudomonas khazarica TaxID=2502979 RepID=UPI002FE393FF
MITPTIQRRSLVEQTIDAIRQLIRAKTWRVGECIPREVELVELFQVGRNTVREAIRVLSHSGMLEVRQGDGTYVRRELDPAETITRLNKSALSDHLEMQCILESEAARFAAMRRTSDDLVRLKKALDLRAAHASGTNVDQLIEHDREFHEAIVDASHNEALQALYGYFSSSLRVLTKTTMVNKALPDPSHADHHAIYEAILSGNDEAAAQAARGMLAPQISRLKE